MDLESFLALEKQRLAEDRQRLFLHSNDYNNTSSEPPPTPLRQPQHRAKNSPTKSEENMNKITKDWINQRQNGNSNENNYAGGGGGVKNNLRTKNKDDMEQWVSDTFYSYFPGFNNENQKRQHELQKRQLENQENLLKHQLLNPGQYKKKKKRNMETTSHLNSARSNNSSLTSNGTAPLHGTTTKTDLEIINVNNPNYVPSKYSMNNTTTSALRPDSARYKLLQDLRHTNITNINAEEINRKQAELDSARKKEYQRELMQQIEDKRRSIKLLRDKEHQQEEVLTRRLQEQLKTMKLEEQLEKERLKAVKVRFDAEQNRLTREHLLAKLENDSQLLHDSNLQDMNNRKVALSNDMNKENISLRNDNKVYKYFSNAEKHDYSSYRNKSAAIPTEIDLVEDQIEMAKIEKECFHLSEKICPMCDGPLKELDNFCLRCQNKLSFRMRQSSTLAPENENTKTETNNNSKNSDNGSDDAKNTTHHLETEKNNSFFLVCTSCERLYSWCTSCTSNTDRCRACQNKRNLCMSCRKTLCSFCLEEVACGKDVERLHINDSSSFEKDKNDSSNTSSAKELSFHVMNNNREIPNNNKNSNLSNLSPQYHNTTLNDLELYNHHPPYSINIEQNSIFHPNHKPSSLFRDTNYDTPREREQNFSFLDKESSQNFLDIDEKNIERLRRDTDKKLTRYLKNYGELAGYQSRGTQTTPNSTGRRDIVLQGEHSLSIPLLREMPKMTRTTENVRFKEHSKDLENLQRRWDIPAVQKYTISQVSPKVVTQVGAIRKQLQVENIFSDDGDS